MQKLILSNTDCAAAARIVANEIREELFDNDAPVHIYGIPRGGVSAAYLIGAALGGTIIFLDSPEGANVIIDDLVDSGQTMSRYMDLWKKDLDNLPIFACLFHKPGAQTHYPFIRGGVSSSWLVFPWEQSSGTEDTSAYDSVTRMMQYVGEDVSREGLLETPKRVVAAWDEWFKGYKSEPKELLKVFEDGAENTDEMVLLTRIPVYSHCEHHITPFIGEAHVAYIPNGKIVGLSKIARVVDAFSRRLQVQERLTNQIADCLQEALNPLGVAVVIKAKHFCMATRGVNTPNVDTTTSAVRGVFKSKPETRAEFMSLIPRD